MITKHEKPIIKMFRAMIKTIPPDAYEQAFDLCEEIQGILAMEIVRRDRKNKRTRKEKP